MADHEKDITTLLEDVRTIKTILQNEDAPFPRVWRAMGTASGAIALAALLQYFVPFFRDLDFDGRVLWLWLPGFCLCFPTVLVILYREIGRSGKRFLGQGRFRHVLFARFVIPPAALVLIWVSSRNTAFPMEGVFLLIVAIWQTAVEQVLPRGFRTIPLGFLILGLIELGLRLAGPEVTLLNALLTAGAISYAGVLFWVQDRGKAGGR